MADADGGRQKSGQGGHGVKLIPGQDLGDGIPEAGWSFAPFIQK